MGEEVTEQHVQRPHGWRRCGVFLELEAAQEAGAFPTFQTPCLREWGVHKG